MGEHWWRYPAEVVEFSTFASKFGGGVDKAAVVLVDYLMQRQDELGIGGPCMEIGVKEGRFLVLMAYHTRDGEQLVGIDPYFDLPELKPVPRQNLEEHARAGGRLTFLYEDSRNVTAADVLPAGSEGFRFIHVDGNHEEDFVYPDLCLAAKTLRPGGIIAMDDYFHFSGVGVSSAIFRFFREHPDTEIVPLLANPPKFYLTTRSHLEAYRKHYLDTFGGERKAIMETTWLGMPFITGSILERLPEHVASLKAKVGA